MFFDENTLFVYQCLITVIICPYFCDKKKLWKLKMPVIEIDRLDTSLSKTYFCNDHKRPKQMGLFLNILVMKKIFLAILFFFVSVICSAPVVDFRLKLNQFRLISEEVDRRYHESEFSRFINDLGYRESKNNWLCVNRIGCFGEWQFAESTLNYLGFRKITLRKFRSNPYIFPRELQIEALRTLIKVNLVYLANYEHYKGVTIKGIAITKSGMIAASHLGGAGSLKKFLNTNGRVNKKDVFGTSVSDYLRKFSGYDLD
jgi:hypothetical protein